MKTKLRYNYDQLSVSWKIYCYKRATQIGYKGKEIKKLIFEIESGKLVGIIDTMILNKIFSV